MKALLIALSLSVLTVAACSKQEESPAQAPVVDSAITESAEPAAQEATEAAAPQEEAATSEEAATASTEEQAESTEKKTQE